MDRYTETVNTEIDRYGFLKGVELLNREEYEFQVSSATVLEAEEEPETEYISPEGYDEGFNMLKLGMDERAGTVEDLADQSDIAEIVLEDSKNGIELEWVDVSALMDSPFTNVSLKHSGLSDSEIFDILGKFTDTMSGYY